MNILKLTLLISLISIKANATTCTYKNLSKTFNFKITSTARQEDIVQIAIEISQKKNPKTIQKVVINCEAFYLNSLDDCENVRSYTTKINSKLPSGHEEDSGNFIVADFNFDGLEDFAIKKDQGGNGGPLYDYFIQDKIRKFYKSTYLSNTVQFFPIEINSRKKTITTLLHANAYQLERSIFKFNSKTKKWKKIYYKLEE